MAETEKKKGEESVDQVLDQDVSADELEQVAGGGICIGNANIFHLKQKLPIEGKDSHGS